MTTGSAAVVAVAAAVAALDHAQASSEPELETAGVTRYRASAARTAATSCPAQARDPRAMPLAEFTTEVMTILEQNRAEKGEILVERVKALRWAERDGTYAGFLSAFASY